MEEFTLTNLQFEEVDKKFASTFIEKYHYSRTCPKSMAFALGQYLNGELVQCMIFASPVGRLMAQEVWETGDASNTIELVRMAAIEPHPKNLESYSISKAIKWIQKNRPQYKVMISYADNEMGHHGYCYQASNFIYYGESSPHPIYYIDGVRTHMRSIFAKYNTNKLNLLQEILGDRLQFTNKGATKNRYFKIIAKDKKEIKKIQKLVKVKSLPYPKGNNEHYDITTDTRFSQGEKQENTFETFDLF